VFKNLTSEGQDETDVLSVNIYHLTIPFFWVPKHALSQSRSRDMTQFRLSQYTTGHGA